MYIQITGKNQIYNDLLPSAYCFGAYGNLK